MPMYAGSSRIVGTSVPGQDLDDVGPREQGSPDVGEERQGQPLEDLLDEAIAAEDLEPDDPQADRHDEDDRRDRHEHVDGRRDRADVRPGVEGVGDDEGDHGRVQGAGVVLAQHARQAVSRHQADLGAHVLDGRHHRQHRERRPERREAVLRAGLGVRPDARGIVVRCPGDEARPEDLAEALQRVLLGPQLGRLGIDGAPGVHARPVGARRRVRIGHGTTPLLARSRTLPIPPQPPRSTAPTADSVGGSHGAGRWFACT